ncbi:MAG: sterol desaturase family protein [Myxococcales bacterium]|jgi:sterol desaturase/sphingolipid hydroxylase (fatty acid hydroxylase superfamily)
MSYDDLVLVSALSGVAGLLLLERLRPARALPHVPWWKIRGALFYALGFVLAGAAPLSWDHLLAPHRLLDLSGLGVLAGAAVGLLVLEFFNYWWHRALHGSDLLWRFVHQMHHSVERMDVAGAMVRTPLGTLAWAAVGSLALVLVVGLRTEAVVLANYVLFFLDCLTHANLRTPRWLGYLVARPEMHGIHHQKGVHRFNYATIPVWDMLFGSYRNPVTWDGEAGFYLGASGRIVDMLLGRDVSQPPRRRAMGEVARRDTDRRGATA